jgi:hypothetical protein
VKQKTEHKHHVRTSLELEVGAFVVGNIVAQGTKINVADLMRVFTSASEARENFVIETKNFLLVKCQLQKVFFPLISLQRVSVLKTSGNILK